jgi:hypothetical protein
VAKDLLTGFAINNLPLLCLVCYTVLVMKRRVPQRVFVHFDFQRTFLFAVKKRKKLHRRRYYLLTKAYLQQAAELSKTRQKQAADPSTTHEELRALARIPALIELIASNPNIPPDLLRVFCRRHPNEILANPSLPLIFLENPGFLHELEPDVLMALLSHPSCPTEYLEVASTHSSFIVRKFVAANLRTPIAILLQLSQDPFTVIMVAKNPMTPTSLIVELAEGEDGEVRRQAILHPSMPKERLRLLQQASGSLTLNSPFGPLLGVEHDSLRTLSHGGLYARQLAARHPDTPIECLEQLAQDKDEQLRIYLAGNPSLIPSLAALLATDEERTVRTCIACHASLPEQSMKLLAHDENSLVRSSLTENVKLPIFLLGGLARDPELEVRAAVIRSCRVTPDILASLSYDPEPEIRLLLCTHPRLPLSVLLQLTKDSELGVRQAAKAREKLLRTKRKST